MKHKNLLIFWMGLCLIVPLVSSCVLLILFSPRDLSNKDPFDYDTQVKVLKEVAKIMKVTLNPNILPPSVLRAEKVSNEYNNSVWGFDVGDKRSNIFDPKTGNIFLIKEAKVHNLAHELAHYIQFTYQGWTDEQARGNYCDNLELEAIRVQNYFR